MQDAPGFSEHSQHPSHPQASDSRQTSCRHELSDDLACHDPDLADVAFAEEMRVIAEVIPLPPCVSHAEALLLERAILLRFEFAEDVHSWLHQPHTRLHGATPFERLLTADVFAVLRALLAEPLLTDVDGSRGRALDDLASLRLVG